MRNAFRAVALTASAVISAASAQAEDYPQIRFQFPHFVAATLPGAVVDQWFADELSKRTSGKVTMRIFWSESGGKAPELLRLASRGGVDVSATSVAYFPSQIPFLAAAALPVAKSAKQAKFVWTMLYKESPALQQEAAENGVRPQIWHPVPPYRIMCRMPIRTMKDLQGKRIRSFGEDFPRLLKAVGATPVTVLPGEMYESLQRGSVDCTLHSLDTLVSYKIYEVAKYLPSISLGALVSWPQWWNTKRWNGLPDNVRKLLGDLERESEGVELLRLEEAERNAIATMKANGVEFIDFTETEKFEQARPDFIADWVEKMSGRGKRAEAEAIAKRWRELLVQTN